MNEGQSAWRGSEPPQVCLQSSINTCMHQYVHVSIRACINTCMYIRVHFFLYDFCSHAHTNQGTCLRLVVVIQCTHACMCVYIYTYIHIDTNKCMPSMHIHAYRSALERCFMICLLPLNVQIHICMYVYTYIHIHTHTYRFGL